MFPLNRDVLKKIDAYIDHLHRKRMHPSSINLYLVILRVFYDYLKYDENISLANPIRRKYCLQVAKPLPKSLRQHEVVQLIDAIDSKRDMAMFKIMLRCGLRVEEVCNLILGAVDLKTRRILVRQVKGGKDRVVYISHDTHDALSAYLKRARIIVSKKPF